MAEKWGNGMGGGNYDLTGKAYFYRSPLVLQYVVTSLNGTREPRYMDQKTSQTRRTNLDVVETFSGAFEFLSNFHTSPFTWQGRVAQTAEHHYNAAKTNDPTEKSLVYEQATPGRAKRVGRRVTLRRGWDDHIKTDV